jgi:hypothetical protein
MPSQSDKNSKKNSKASNNEEQTSQSKEKVLSKFWRKLWHDTSITDKTQIILAFVGIATLVTIYF